MRTVALVVAAVGLVLTPTWASEPGQPLDCDDWLVFAPGLTIAWTGFSGQVIPSDRIAIDGAGRYVSVGGMYPVSWPSECDGSTLKIAVLPPQGDPSSSAVVACLPSRSGPLGGVDRAESDSDNGSCFLGYVTHGSCVFMNQLTGELFFTYRAVGEGYPPPGVNQYTNYNTLQRCVLRGLPSLSDVLQTFQPPATLGFYVPSIPEGFPAADWFDTYYGDLATVGDWSQAQPLQCGYPSTPPAAGDYLTVADTLPDPPPGTGRYYVTAVTHQGQRRYGRKSMNGVLSGRDPAVLPGCEQ